MRPDPKPLILVVEDEAELASLIAAHLEAAEMQVQICSRADHAMRFLKRNHANLILLDVNLPDQSGFAFLQAVRGQDMNIPTIFLTGNDHEVSKVRAFDLGGDDYVTKPFGYPELVARIRAVLRRSEGRDDLNLTKNTRIDDDPFTVVGARIVPLRLEIEFPDGGTLKIGRKELGILAYIHEHQGAVIPRKALIHSVWGLHADVRSRSLDQYIVKIRDMFRNHGLSLDTFRTVHGVGYIFDPDGVVKQDES